MADSGLHELNAEVRILAIKLEHETEMRETVERLGNIALQKAENFITEKSAAHNDILSRMEKLVETFATKDDLEKRAEMNRSRMLAFISVGGFIVLVINFALQNFIR